MACEGSCSPPPKYTYPHALPHLRSLSSLLRLICGSHVPIHPNVYKPCQPNGWRGRGLHPWGEEGLTLLAKLPITY